MRASCPTGVGENAAIGIFASQIILIAFRLFIEISVLVMDAEEEAQFFHGIGQFPHTFPTTGFFAGRPHIRVLIIVARISPAIQMEIELLYTIRL